MGRFNASDIENYGTQTSNYFSLKNDKDVANVRFMYNSIEDVEGYAVHEVEVDGKKRYTNCLRDYNEPIDNCPFCKAGKSQLVKLFVPLYDTEQNKVRIWERGRKFFSKLSSLCSRYNNLVSHTFDIERNGKAGDQQTTYEIFETGGDNTTLEDLPEIDDIIGTIVLSKNCDEMRYYLENGEFPADGVVNRRRTADEAPVRRTPTSRGDRF